MAYNKRMKKTASRSKKQPVRGAARKNTPRRRPATVTARKKPASKPATRKPAVRKPVTRKPAARKPATRKPAKRTAAKSSPERRKQTQATTGRFQPGDRFYVTEQQRRTSQAKRAKFEARGIAPHDFTVGGFDMESDLRKEQKRKKGKAVVGARRARAAQARRHDTHRRAR